MIHPRITYKVFSHNYFPLLRYFDQFYKAPVWKVLYIVVTVAAHVQDRAVKVEDGYKWAGITNNYRKNSIREFVYNIIDCWEFLRIVCHNKIQNVTDCTKLFYC